MNGAALRVLHFLTDFRIGGTERQCVALARGLARERFEVHVGCLARSGGFAGEIEGPAASLTAYPVRNLYGPVSMLRRLRLARDLTRRHVHVLHAFGFYPNLFAVPAARAARVPAVIASIRDTGEMWTPAQRRAQGLVCRMADRVVVNARAVADRLRRDGYDPARIEVIPNGVDLSRFPREGEVDGLRAELDFPPGAPVVAVVGRLSEIRGMEIKGVRHFLDAASALSARFEAARFLVVGDGDARAGLEAHAARLGLAGRVAFTGFRLDVPRVLAQVSVAVLPSLTEAMSNSLLEAMAAGRPVVATRVGGSPEVVDDGVTGLLVPAGDPEAIASAVARLLADPATAERLGRAGRERVERKFSLERMVRDTERLYESLVEDAGRRVARAEAT